MQEHERFNIPDVSCGHCKSAIEGALRPMDGIKEADVHVDDKVVDVTYQPDVITRDRVVQVIESAGYPVGS